MAKNSSANSIKLLVTRFFGVVASNEFVINKQGEQTFKCSATDFEAMKSLIEKGIKVVWLIDHQIQAILDLADLLGVTCWCLQDDKVNLVESLAKENALEISELAYIGSNDSDIPVMKIVGMPIASANCGEKALPFAMARLHTEAGEGALDEAASFLVVNNDQPSEMTLEGRPVPEFPTPTSVGERPWGEEILLLLSSKKYSFKKLKITKGSKGGLQYHRLKDEGGIVLSGKLLVRYVCPTGQITKRICEEGTVFRFPPGCIHQEEAITDVTLLEVSTPHFNDRVRCDHLINEQPIGLPSTKLNEVEIK